MQTMNDDRSIKENLAWNDEIESATAVRGNVCSVPPRAPDELVRSQGWECVNV